MTPADRIAELEAENRRLRETLAAIKATLQEIRLAWCEERLARAEAVEARSGSAVVLPYPRGRWAT